MQKRVFFNSTLIFIKISHILQFFSLHFLQDQGVCPFWEHIPKIGIQNVQITTSK